MTLLAVSLKAYFDHRRTLQWCRDLRDMLDPMAHAGVDLAVLPEATAIVQVRELLADHGIEVGAQNCSAYGPGAFTGEFPATHLAAAGCRYVEIGHAERRRLFGETDEVVAAKLISALRAGLIPILCIGEEQRLPFVDAAAACRQQLLNALREPQMEGVVGALVIAYEPVWAIGAERAAPADHVRAVCTEVQATLAEQWPSPSRVIYGGAAGPGVLEELGGSVDGLFLGRYAHDVAALWRVVVEAVARRHR